MATTDTGELNNPKGSTPVPDPTELTDRAIAKAVITFEQQIQAQKEFFDAKFVAKDKEHVDYVKTAQEQLDNFKEVSELKVQSLRDLVAQQFELIEKQRVEQKKDTKDAVDAALTAQKEAVREQTVASERSIAKSETATAKQLEQQTVTFSTSTEALRRSIDEVKERQSEANKNALQAATDLERNLRQTIGEVSTVANGTVSQKQGSLDTRTLMFALFGAAGALIGFVSFVISFKQNIP